SGVKSWRRLQNRKYKIGGMLEGNGKLLRAEGNVRERLMISPLPELDHVVDVMKSYCMLCSEKLEEAAEQEIQN
ncbi:hypothetical protein KI387_030463, partial [Taxus chinensis]